jgi:hypothetical protein
MQAVERHGKDSPYQVLGVAEDDLGGAKRAMKLLSLKLHPDHRRGDSEIQGDAYDTVKYAWELLKPEAEAPANEQVYIHLCFNRHLAKISHFAVGCTHVPHEHKARKHCCPESPAPCKHEYH